MPSSDDMEDQLRGAQVVKRNELLSYEELLRIVRVASSMGMNKLRLTGGEPLVRRGIMQFIGSLQGINGLQDIRLTTNGVLLHEKAQQLYDFGIRNINISLDTMEPKKFAEITGRNYFDKVWRGLQTAITIGFNIKINVVAMKGVNDDEFEMFARLALSEPVQVRFIEFMPLGKKSSWQKKRFIHGEEILKIIGTVGHYEPIKNSSFEGPARMYSLIGETGKKGRVGVISPISHHFCDQCNRLRLTSEGTLRSCLLHDMETDLKKLIRGGCTDDDIQQMIRETILLKPKGHKLGEELSGTGGPTCIGQMSKIGG